MADLTIDASDVLPVEGQSRIREGFATVAIAAGEAVRILDRSARTVAKAFAGDELSMAHVDGVAVNSADEGQPITFALGTIVIDTGTEGAVIALSSANAGKLAPLADLGAGDHVVVVGVITSDGLMVEPINSGATIPE